MMFVSKIIRNASSVVSLVLFVCDGVCVVAVVVVIDG